MASSGENVISSVNGDKTRNQAETDNAAILLSIKPNSDQDQLSLGQDTLPTGDNADTKDQDLRLHSDESQFALSRAGGSGKTFYKFN